MPSARCLDEGDFVDLFESSQSAADAVEGGFAEEAHAFSASEPANFGGWLLFKDDLADRVGQVEELVDSCTAAIAGAAALHASGAFAEREVDPLGGIHAV